MSVHSVTITGIAAAGTETAGAAIITAPATADRHMGRHGVISKIRVKQNSGDGTQWAIRLYAAWTAAPKTQIVTKITTPSVAGTFANGSDEDVGQPDPPAMFSTMFSDFADGWTDTDTPKAGLTLFATAAQLANGGATADSLTVEITVKRR